MGSNRARNDAKLKNKRRIRQEKREALISTLKKLEPPTVKIVGRSSLKRYLFSLGRYRFKKQREMEDNSPKPLQKPTPPIYGEGQKRGTGQERYEMALVKWKRKWDQRIEEMRHAECYST
jgi:hypothetical protein